MCGCVCMCVSPFACTSLCHCEEGPAVQPHHGMGEMQSQFRTAEILNPVHPGRPLINWSDGQGAAAPGGLGHL